LCAEQRKQLSAFNFRLRFVVCADVVLRQAPRAGSARRVSTGGTASARTASATATATRRARRTASSAGATAGTAMTGAHARMLRLTFSTQLIQIFLQLVLLRGVL